VQHSKARVGIFDPVFHGGPGGIRQARQFAERTVEITAAQLRLGTRQDGIRIGALLRRK
jgi:hypothetical protein